MVDEDLTPDQLVARCLDASDPLSKREVPALALALLGASVAETSRITDGLLDYYEKRYERERERAERAEQGLRDVQSLMGMLADPRASRVLVRIVEREMYRESGGECAEEDG